MEELSAGGVSRLSANLGFTKTEGFDRYFSRESTVLEEIAQPQYRQPAGVTASSRQRIEGFWRAIPWVFQGWAANARLNVLPGLGTAFGRGP